ncbi:endocellulase [Mycena filopes]|nr:endocellulase [Mycena filopes]
MHLSTSIVLRFLFTGLASAQTITGANDCLAAGRYTLCQNLWGAASGVGSQQSTLTGTTTSTVSWRTNYTWADGPSDVKSYANVISNTAKGVRLANISSLATSWEWSYASQSAGLRADVSYDIWLGDASVGNPASTASRYEIMIWLSGIGGAQPLGKQLTTATAIANHTWNLWKGTNKTWTVYSFVSSAGTINSFNQDLNAFFTYLGAEYGVLPSQYLQAIQAGTEPFTGSANVVTSSYSVSVVQK